MKKQKETQFPVNVFPDVKPEDFNKLNKKNVTEDFVAENFKRMGWQIYEPFTDTGIDRIATKKICPKGHTPTNISEEVCTQCNANTIEITRFLQIKTRSLKNNIFGFTIKSKDIRIDPRHTFVLYCDTTQDFFILSMYDYLNFFKQKKINPFAATSFRKGNQKLNSLKYYKNKQKWYWGKHSWEHFRNENGLKILQNPKIDKNLGKWIKLTRELSNELLIKFVSGGTYSSQIEKLINKELKTKLKRYSKKSNIIKIRKTTLDYLRKSIKNKGIFDSIMKYWETIKNLEI